MGVAIPGEEMMASLLVRDRRPVPTCLEVSSATKRHERQVEVSKYTVEAKSSPAPYPPISFRKENIRAG